MQHKKESVYVTPIGGLEEVGKNMMVIEYKEDMIIVDCGLKFPKLDTPGVDFVINDFNYIKQKSKNLRALVITHGHLDHIGAIPELFNIIKVKVYCTKFTKSLIDKMFDNYPKTPRPNYQYFNSNKKFTIGHFTIEGIPVNHSIIEAHSLAIETKAGTIIHTGDWRIDTKSNNNETIDIKKFKEYGKKGLLALFSDSTNAVKKGYNISEDSVSENLENMFLTTKGRLIIATFSSQINRIKEIIHLAKVFNRKIAIIGRSMQNMIELSSNLNILKKKDLFIDKRKIKNIAPEQLVILSTGTQGEDRSGLWEIANDSHKYVSLNKNDTIVFSSSFIPGNEFSINKLLNLLHKKELKIITSKDMDIHTTGHASVEELRTLIRWTKPQYFIPIHGENIQLINHKKIALKEGIAENNIHILENGQVLALDQHQAKVVDKVKLKTFYREGNKNQVINKELFDERLALSENGVVFIYLVIKELKLQEVEIKTKGFVDRNNAAVIQEIKDLVIDYVGNNTNQIKNKDDLEILIRRYIKKYLLKTINKTPTLFLKLNHQ